MKGAPVEYVVGFVFSEDGKRVLLIKKTKPAWMNGLLNGIGGKIEKGETASVAMRREAIEEAGLDLEWRPVFMLQAANKHYNVPDATIYVFRAISDITLAEAKTEEQLEIHQAHELPTNIVSNLAWIVPFVQFGNISGFPIIRERAAA